MRIIIFIISALLLLLVQDSILIPLYLTPVNLLLLFLVAATIFSDFNEGLAVALITGIMLDLVSGSTDGLIGLTMIGLFLALHFILNTFLARDANLIILFSSVAASTVLYYLVMGAVSGRFRLIEFFLLLCFNILFTYPVFRYFIWIHSKLKPKAYGA